MHGGGRQGVAGHRDGRPGDGTRHSRTSNRGVAVGIGEHGADRVDRRSGADGGAVLHVVRRQDPGRRKWTTCCAGRRPSSTSQKVQPVGESIILGNPGGHGPGVPRGCRVEHGTPRLARRHATSHRDGSSSPTRFRMRPPSPTRTTHYPTGYCSANDAVLAEIGEALQMAERSAEDIALVLIRMTMGIALVEAESADADSADTTCWQSSAKHASRKSTH